MATCLVGSCFGFLKYNREPARMYLGDTGSMMLGTLLGGLLLVGEYSQSNELAAFIAPLCFLSIPLFDLGLVVCARLLAKRPIYYGSTDHFAVRLKAAGWSPNQITYIAAFMGFLMMGAGLFLSRLSSADAFLMVSVIILFGCLLLFTIFARYPAPPENKG